MAEKYYYATTAPWDKITPIGCKVQRIYAIVPKTPLRMEVTFREDPDENGNEPSKELHLNPSYGTRERVKLLSLLTHEGGMLPNEACGLVEQFVLAGTRVRFYVHKEK